eukprot:4140419-Amphidinium_carterae.4
MGNVSLMKRLKPLCHGIHPSVPTHISKWKSEIESRSWSTCDCYIKECPLRSRAIDVTVLIESMLNVFAEVNACLKGPNLDVEGVLGSSDSRASGESRGIRLLAHLEAGLLAYSDFSGWDSQEESLRLATERFLQVVAPGKAAYGFVWVLGHKNF